MCCSWLAWFGLVWFGWENVGVLLSVGLVGLVWFGLGGWRCGAVGWFGLASFPLGVVWCGLAGVVWLGFGPVHVPAGMRFGLGRGFFKKRLYFILALLQIS